MPIALVVAGAFFMENLDGTVIATALPQMARSFGVAPVDLSVGMTAYLLALAVFIPASGWVADRLGARTVFGGAIAVFTFASVLCSAADGLWTFTAARVLQGMGGALMVPVGRMVVLRTTAKPDLMRAMAYITWPGLVAPVLGPPLGGFFTTFASWRWIFLLNVPLGLIGLLLVARLFPNVRGAQRRRFDGLGFVLSGIALPCLMYGMELVGRPDANPALAAAVLLCAAGFGVLAVRHMGRVAEPLIDLGALRIPSFAATVWGGSVFRVTIGAIPLLVPLLLQVGFGLSAFDAGLLVLAGSAGNLGMKVVTTPILRRFGFRNVLVVNGLLTSVSIAGCALLSPSTPAWAIVLVLFAGGLCRSMQFTSLNTLQFADIPGAQMSGASTLSSMVQQMAMGMGIALGALVLQEATAIRGDAAPALADFRVAFLVVGGIVLMGVLRSLRLDPAAGAEVSAHRKFARAPAGQRQAG